MWCGDSLLVFYTVSRTRPLHRSFLQLLFQRNRLISKKNPMWRIMIQICVGWMHLWWICENCIIGVNKCEQTWTKCEQTWTNVNKREQYVNKCGQTWTNVNKHEQNVNKCEQFIPPPDVVLSCLGGLMWHHHISRLFNSATTTTRTCSDFIAIFSQKYPKNTNDIKMYTKCCFDSCLLLWCVWMCFMFWWLCRPFTPIHSPPQTPFGSTTLRHPFSISDIPHIFAGRRHVACGLRR